MPLDSLHIVEPCRFDLQCVGEAAPTAHQIDARELFGSLTQPARPAPLPEMAHSTPTMCDSMTFRLAVAALMVFYCIAIYRYRACVRTLFRTAGNRLHVEKILSENNRIFRRLLWLFSLLGLLAWPMAGLCFAQAAELLSPGILEDRWATETMFGVAMAAMTAFIVWRRLTLSLTGWLTMSRDFVLGLFLLTQMIFVMATILLTPLLLLLALNSDPMAVETIVLMIVLLLTLALGMLLYKTFKLFVAQKISILYWFLYLCAVEIFPLSLAMLI